MGIAAEAAPILPLRSQALQLLRDPQQLADIYPRLLRHGIAQFQSRDVMRFLGKRLTPSGNVPRSLQAEVLSDLRHRPEGVRIKHKLGWNSVKLYDKEGSVLRIETTIKVSGTHRYVLTRNGRKLTPALLAARQADVEQLTTLAA